MLRTQNHRTSKQTKHKLILNVYFLDIFFLFYVFMIFMLSCLVYLFCCCFLCVNNRKKYRKYREFEEKFIEKQKKVATTMLNYRNENENVLLCNFLCSFILLFGGVVVEIWIRISCNNFDWI